MAKLSNFFNLSSMWYTVYFQKLSIKVHENSSDHMYFFMRNSVKFTNAVTIDFFFPKSCSSSEKRWEGLNMCNYMCVYMAFSIILEILMVRSQQGDSFEIHMYSVALFINRDLIFEVSNCSGNKPVMKE